MAATRFPHRALVSSSLVLTVALASLSLGCGEARSILERVRPAPTATADWVGKIQEEATPMATFQTRIAAEDPRTGQSLASGVALRTSAGRGAEPTGDMLQPGERIYVTGVAIVGSERFFKVRSFDGMRRGWISESALAPDERPPRAASYSAAEPVRLIRTLPPGSFPLS